MHVIGDEIRFSTSSNVLFYGTISHDASTTGNNFYNCQDTGGHVFQLNGTEKARIDSSGRLLVGTSSTSSSLPKLIVSGGADGGVTPAILVANTDSAPAVDVALGLYDFSAANHSTAARIAARRDGGTWTAGSSQPTRLVFSTTADGASSPTERMRISSSGLVSITGELTSSGKIATSVPAAVTSFSAVCTAGDQTATSLILLF